MISLLDCALIILYIINRKMERYNVLEELTKKLINDACKNYTCIQDLKLCQSDRWDKINVSFYGLPEKTIYYKKRKTNNFYIPKKNEKKMH